MNGSTCNDGKCTDAACVVTYTCTCDNGWAGNHCEINLDECASYPCTNGGTCVDGVFSYGCVCGAGYDGYNCEADADECLSSPCMNGASCLDSSLKIQVPLDRFTCVCAPGYAGDICETHVDECASSPCLHGGTCDQGIDSYTCTCAWVQGCTCGHMLP